MFGFFIGTACLIGLIATVRRGFHHGYQGHCGYAGGGGCGPRHGHHHQHSYERSCEGEGSWGGYREEGRRSRRGFRGFGPRAWISGLSERLDLTPAQEKVLFQAFGEVRETMRKQRGELSDTRKDVARAFRATSFDAVIMGDMFGRHDNKLDEVRKAMVGALAKVHEALDERQREKLAEMLEGQTFGGGWW